MQWYASLVDRKNMALHKYLNAIRGSILSGVLEQGVYKSLDLQNILNLLHQDNQPTIRDSPTRDQAPLDVLDDGKLSQIKRIYRLI